MFELTVFLVGLAITAVGATKFSKAASQLASLLKIKRVLIGATIISLATTAPEAIVAVLSSAQNHSGLALGNALGSPVANLGLILGLVLIFGKVNFERNVLKATLLLFVLSVYSYMIVFFQKTINAVGGFLLILAGLSYLLFLVKTIEDEQGNHQNFPGIGALKKLIQTIPTFFKLILGLGLILFGGFLIIQGAVSLGKILGVSEIFIGLTLVALGTSLPELALALVSILKKSLAVSVGNLIGASTLTLTLTLGLAAIVAPVKTAPSVFFLDFPAVLIISAAFLLVQYLNIPPRALGISFVVFYIFYIVALKVVG